MMKDGASFACAAAAIFDDCNHMSCEFPHVLFEHCPREASGVVHELASIARFSNPIIWMEDGPPSIVPLLVKDVTLIINE